MTQHAADAVRFEIARDYAFATEVKINQLNRSTSFKVGGHWLDDPRAEVADVLIEDSIAGIAHQWFCTRSKHGPLFRFTYGS